MPDAAIDCTVLVSAFLALTGTAAEFLTLGTYRRIHMLTPRQFLDTIGVSRSPQ